VVSSCPWKIDAQATTGVQITLAREKFSFLKINDKKTKAVPFSKYQTTKKNKLYYTKNDRNNYNKKTEINKNLNKQDKIIKMSKI
jgi:hypothetical protein